MAHTPQTEARFTGHWLLEAFASLSSASADGHQHLPLRIWMPVHGWHPLCSLISVQPYQGPQMPRFLEQSQSYCLTLPTSLDSNQLAHPATPKASHCRLTSPFLARHPTHFYTTHSAFLRRLRQRTLCLGGARHSVPTTVQAVHQAMHGEGFHTQ